MGEEIERSQNEVRKDWRPKARQEFKRQANRLRDHLGHLDLDDLHLVEEANRLMAAIHTDEAKCREDCERERKTFYPSWWRKRHWWE